MIIVSYILIVILGAALGSFFNVVISRLPQGQSIVHPPSRCPGCHKRIKPWRNIPVVSWLALRGRCPDCGCRIHWHYPLVEALTPLIFLSLFLASGSTFDPTFGKWAIFFGVSLIIFFIDSFHMLIPDVLSIPLIIVGLLISLLPDMDIGFYSAFSGAAFAFLFFWGLGVLYQKVRKIDGLGGGDVKYIAAVGAFVGFPWVLFVMVAAAIVAVVFFLAMRLRRDQAFAFGPFLVVGTYIFVLAGESVMNWYVGLLSL